MPKGKTRIKFIGGCNDGFHDDAVDTRVLASEMAVRTGYWYREEKQGVSIMKGGALCDNWHSFGVHVYKKCEKAKDGYLVYKLSEKKVVDRCSAVTKQGKKCRNTALMDLSLCSTHNSKT